MSDDQPRLAAGFDRSGIVIGLLLIALSGLLAWDAFGIAAGAAGYARIGPRVFPYAIALGLLALGLATIFQARKGTPERPSEEIAPMAWIIGGLLVQIALFPIAGFSVATAAVFAGTAKGFGRGPLWLTYLVGLVVAFLIWVAFDIGLKLTLPEGPIERFLRGLLT